MDPALRKSLIMSAVSSFATLGIATYYLTQYAPQLPAPPPLVHVSTTTSTSTTAPSGKKECEHCANANSKKASGSSKAVASGSGSTKDDPKEKEKEKDANRKGPDEGKSYRTCRQYWNEQTSSWQTRTHVPPKKTEEMNEGCLFVANHRTLLPKHQVQAEDYWHIEVLDEQLVKDLRTQLTEVEAIYEDKPQLDAQDIFLHIEGLKELIGKREEYIERRSKGGEKGSIFSIFSTGPQITVTASESAASSTSSSSSSASTSSQLAETETSVSSNENEIHPRSSFVSHSLGASDEAEKEEGAEEKPSDPKAEREVERQKEREKELDAMDVERLKKTVDALKELVEFVKEAFDNVSKKLDRLLPDNQISWNLLWCIFKPQDNVVTYHEVSGEPMAFKLKSCSYLDNGQYKFVSLQGQKLEWNGKKFSRTWHEVRLLKWKGLRKISSLMAFPMTDELKKELTERGRLYAKLAGTPKYLHYTGVLSRVEGHGMERRIIKLRAEGRIVVDVKSYRRMNPTKDIWSRSWYARSRSGPGGKSSSRQKISDDEDAGENSLLGSNIADEDLCLTPPTIYAFSLVLKDWGEIKVDEVKEIVFDEDAYEHLVLDEDHKDMIKCLVDATAGENKTNKIVTDVISGKGGGAIVVLHGNPGTGKTLTAEAVAEHLKRPLYSVGAGELGVHAEVLERRLRDTLEVAKTWGAVLLIDEADVFLEERSLRDVSRNAMVSVFLRLLEYHSGVLFLTTNRIKSFDEAFLSRFSVALKYPNLDKEKRKMIWIKFLELSGFKIDLSIQSPTKLKLPAQKVLPPTVLTPPDSPPASPKPSAPTVQVVTAGDLDRLASKIFNGRSIKNIIRTAQALAISAKEPTSVRHVDKVMRIAEQFTKDFQETDEVGMYEVEGEGWKDKTRMHY